MTKTIKSINEVDALMIMTAKEFQEFLVKQVAEKSREAMPLNPEQIQILENRDISPQNKNDNI